MKPVMIYGIVVIVAIVLVIIAARYYKNEEFVSTNEGNEKNQIVENYPTAPQNVLVSDANGNLSVTNDLGLQHLAVAGNLSVGGSVRLSGDVTASNRNILAELDKLAKSIADLNTRVDAVNSKAETANTSIAAANVRIDTINDTAVFYNTAVKTLANNGIMGGGMYSGDRNIFMSFGNCDQCAGGSDKFKLWPGAGSTTSFKFVKNYS
jgi:ribosomal protein S11